MSAKVTGAVWDLDLGHAQQLVLLALADHADHDGGSIFPSVNRVAYKTGYSKRQTQRIMAELREAGVLIEVRPAKDHRPTEYRIDATAAPKKPPYSASGQKMPAGMREQVIEEGRQTCALCHQRGDATHGPDGQPWHVDRIVQGNRGGRYEWDNVRLACGTCNRSRPQLPGCQDGTPDRDAISADRGAISSNRGATATAPEPSTKPSKEPPVNGREDDPFVAWLEHHVSVTGNRAGARPGTAAHTKARAAYEARRREMPDEDLQLISIGAMAHEYRREKGYTSAVSVLRPDAASELLERGRRAAPSQSDWQGDALLERTRRQYA